MRLRRDSLLESDSDVPPHSDALRVLIVDDDALLRWALAETLADSGHVTIQARDAASAIRAMSDQPIDVILLDLPDSGRLTLLSTLRRLAPATAIIVTIDHRTPGVKIPAIRLGAHRVVTKPLEMDQVAALVSHANRCRPI